LPCTHIELPAPRGGKVIALGDGPSCLTESGELWFWPTHGNQWQRVGNALHPQPQAPRAPREFADH